MSEYIAIEKLQQMRREIDALVRACEHTAIQLPEEPIPPMDGKPVVRPHSIPGWWQVWGGSMCFALLRPEDVAPIVEAARVALAEAAKPRRPK
jgi:hypothetical protein